MWVRVCLALSALAVPSGAQTGQPSTQAPLPEANPARPTVSNPATLTPVGYLQFENGLLAAWNSPEFSSRAAFEQATKLTVHPRLELILALEPIIRSLPVRQAGRTQAGHAVEFGDVVVGAQGVLLPGHDAKPTIALAYYADFHSSPAPDIDIGSFRHEAVLLVSADVAGFHVDANGIFAVQHEGSVRRAQYGQTLSISHPVGKIVLTGEIWHFTQPFLRGNTVGNLWAVSYAPRRNLVLDTGFNYGFNSTSTRWEYFAGFTYVLPHRLWSERAASQP